MRSIQTLYIVFIALIALPSVHLVPRGAHEIVYSVRDYDNVVKMRRHAILQLGSPYRPFADSAICSRLDQASYLKTQIEALYVEEQVLHSCNVTGTALPNLKILKVYYTSHRREKIRPFAPVFDQWNRLRQEFPHLRSLDVISEADGTLLDSYMEGTFRSDPLEPFKEIVASGLVDVNIRLRQGDFPLTYAVWMQKADWVQVLLDRQDIDTSVINPWGRTAIQLAVWRPCPLSILKELLAKNSSGVNTVDPTGVSPLMKAALIEDAEKSYLLLAAGADPNTKGDHNWTPLTYAILQDRLRLARTMVTKYGADIQQRDEDGNSLLHLATSAGSFRSMQFLLNSGLSAKAGNKKHLTPLHLSRDSEKTNLLLKKGAAINAMDALGRSPLHIACSQTQSPIAIDNIQALLDAGASPISRDNRGTSPLVIALKTQNKALVKILKTPRNNGRVDKSHQRQIARFLTRARRLVRTQVLHA